MTDQPSQEVNPPGIGELVNALTVGMTFRGIYFQEHPKVSASADNFIVCLRTILQAKQTDTLVVGVAKRRLVYEGKPLVGATLIARRIIEFATRLQCGGFRFLRDISAAEVLELFAVFVETRSELPSLEAARALFSSRSITHVELSPPYGDSGWLGSAEASASEGITVDSESLQRTITAYQSLVSLVEDAHDSAARGGELNVNAARTQAEMLLKQGAGQIQELLAIARYPDYDSYTIGHSVRVALLTMLVGLELSYAQEALIELGSAGLLHDVGKSQIPHEILFKNGPLNDDERRSMGEHPRIGGELLIESKEASALSIGAAFGHHIRHDRRGYPQVSKWAVLGRATSLVQVCDVFEALTAVRPYKPSLSPRKTFELMMSDRTAFDPVALKAFVRAIGIYPPGSRVRLSTGEEAVVIRSGCDIQRPTVRVTLDKSGNAVSPEQPLIDLGKRPASSCSVVELLREETRKVEADASQYCGRPTTVLLEC